MGETIINPDIKKAFPWKLSVIFILFSGAIIIMGSYYYRYERNRIFAEQEKTLSAIATLKIKQISQWYSGKLADAVVIKDNEPLISRIKQFFKDENQTGIRKEITIWLEALNTQYDYNSVALLDTLLRVKIATSNADPLADESIRKELNNVIRYHKIIMTDLHRTGTRQAIRMDLLVPLLDSLSNKQKTIGLIILCIDPDKILFPLVQSWPTPSKSSETLILRREGDSVLFLNELRHRKNSALNLKFPLSDVNRLGSKAVNGFEGVTEGIDYRNVPVIGALSKIPVLPWYMVAKTDKNEILEPFQRYSIITVVVIILLIILNGLFFGYWIRVQRINMYRLQLSDEIALRKSEELLTRQYYTLKGIVESSGGPIFSLDRNYFYTSFNKSHALTMKMLYGADIELGKSMLDYQTNNDDKIKAKGNIDRALSGENIEEREWSGDDPETRRFFEVIHNPILNDQNGVIGVAINARDLTERKKIEEKLIESEEKFRKAFFTNPDSVTITRLDNGTYVSVNDGFTDTFEYSEEEIIGKTPFDISIWHNVDERKLFINGLKAEGKVRNFETKFYTKSRRLIDCLISATTISLEGVDHVISNTRDISYRKNAELALLDSEKRFRTLYENATIGIYRTTLDGKILMANPALVKMLGFSSFDDLAHRNLEEEGYEPDYPRAKFLETLEKEGKIIGLESAWHQRDGNTLYVRENASVIRDADGKILYYDGNVEDITYWKQAEQALRESEERFSKSFRTSPISFMIANIEDGRIIEINDAFSSISGFTREEALGNTTLNMKIWVHEEDRKHIIDSLREGNAILHQETLLQAKDGNVSTVLLSAQVIKLANRNCIISSIEDITKRKEAEDELRIQSEIMSHMAEAVYLVRMEDGIIVYTNSKFEELFGYGPGDMTGKHVSIVNAPAEKSPEQTAIEIMNQLDKKGFWTGEVLNIKKDGTVFWSHANVAIFNHSKYGKVLVSVQEDITDRKNAEFQIKKLNEELEVRVIQRTQLLEAANKELEAFSYSVSHDLRAPLRSVHGFTKILLEDYEASLDEEGKRICGIISSSATQMGALIDDLLSFSRIGRSSLHPSEIDMKKMAKLIFEKMTSPTERKRIKMNIGRLSKAFGDVTLFGQVWTNLISNAIKYTSKNDISEINIGSKVDEKMITYFIKDNGVGFDMQYAHKLFGVFQRLHSEAEFEGNGVGLAIIQRIVLKHGGKVWAEGEVGKGATFYFSLPVQDINKKTRDTRLTTHG
jgi:PAS domain S-box-containing protein